MRPYRKPTNEDILTRQIRDVLNHVGYFHYKAWQGPMSRAGVSDIIGLTKPGGRFFAIEVKAPKGKASPAQLNFLADVKLCGGLVVIAKSVEDVIEGLGLQDKFVEYRDR
jgi:hypothetical protein